MNEYLNLMQYFLYGFFFALVVSPFIISFIKRENVKQVILHYVDSHKSKNGTPTMGGMIFLISISVISLICFKDNSLFAKVSILIFLAYGLIGFLDDFIKLKNKRNLGLRAYQKIIFQLLVSIFAGWFVYKNMGGIIVVPFSNAVVDLKWGIIPVVVLVFLATTNSVNLTDGLDGLASGTSFMFFLTFVILQIVLINKGCCFEIAELKNLNIISVVACGVILCFLLFNCFPAKIFMGDTGSLALGGLVSSVVVFSGMELYLPILGVMFVASSVSVILQVAYYKLTKKRIFLMAPLHHHFEKKGVHEVRITLCYALITLIVGVLTIIINIL